MNRLQWLRFASLAVGAMDASTGLMLIVAPTLTLKLMQVPAVSPESSVFLSWMGVFIASIGLSYGLVLKGTREAEVVWMFTAIVRLSVACFVTTKIIMGDLPSAWILVAATDGIVAMGQWLGLRAGWWKGGAG